MAAKDLITLARAYDALQNVSSQDSLLGVLITAASDIIQKWCRRDFVATSYDELYSGNGQRNLLLRQYPLISVESVRYRPVTVLKITNTDPTNVQARVTVTSTGLTLLRVNTGVKTTDTSVTFAGHLTLTAVASAVNALGNGWSAQVVGDSTNYGSWPSVDLFWPPAFPTFNAGSSGQGALQCVAGSFAELKMHTYELQGYQWDSRGWLLRAIPYTDPELLHPEDLVWPVGVNNLRVQYTAGYATVPEAVQEACAEWTAAMYFQCSRDPLLTNQLTTGGAASAWKGTAGAPPEQVLALLRPIAGTRSRRTRVNGGRGSTPGLRPPIPGPRSPAPAMTCSGKCVPVRSRWVAQFILTADCALAVWFKNGVCCLYPGTTQAWFDLAVAAPSPGHYVHQFLYKKLPYRIIRPPCPPAGGVSSACAPGTTLPATVYATLANSIDCACAAGTIALVYDAGAQQWAGTGALGSCGPNVTLTFACAAGASDCGGYRLGVSWSDGCHAAYTALQPDLIPACSNTPLAVQFSVGVGPACGCTGGGAGFFVNVTV